MIVMADQTAVVDSPNGADEALVHFIVHGD
jgi:hypothetical protein